MQEQLKAARRWINEPQFRDVYLKGHGLDCSIPDDGLKSIARMFPQIGEITDIRELCSDVFEADDLPRERFDFLNSNMLLASAGQPLAVLKKWIESIKFGGYVVLLLPDDDLYNLGMGPGKFCADHKSSFTAALRSVQSKNSFHVYDLVSYFSRDLQLVRFRTNDDFYRYDHAFRDRDQSRDVLTECSLELVFKRIYFR